MRDFGYYLRRLFFLGAFVLVGLAAVEKVLNLFGFTVLSDYYSPKRLLEFGAIALLFIVVLQLREINLSLTARNIKEEPKKHD